jgi:hypothetical protein
VTFPSTAAGHVFAQQLGVPQIVPGQPLIQPSVPLQPPSRQPGPPAFMPPMFQQPQYQQPQHQQAQYQQLQYYPPTGFAPPSGQFYQPFQQQQATGSSSQVPNAAQKKKKKKKAVQQNIPLQSQTVVPQVQLPYVQPSATAPVPVSTADPVVQLPLPSSAQTLLPVDIVPEVPKKKCWKCAVDTHSTRECKVQYYCLVCDNGNHPTLRCPTLKMPRQLAYVAGSGCEEGIYLQMPACAYKAHLAPTGSPTALISITGDPVSAGAIEELLARICPLNLQWKWEAIPHGTGVFLVSFPSLQDLNRMNGIQMGIPESSSQMTVSIWQSQDIPHKKELHKVWVHVEGVPHTVRHFHGLWAVASLIGTPLDVDL